MRILLVEPPTLEKPTLEIRFGEGYLEYKMNTSFLIPRLEPVVLDFVKVLSTRTKEGSSYRLLHLRRVQIVFYAISLLCLSILASLVLTLRSVDIQAQKETIGAAFGAICILGIAAGLSPSRCNRLLARALHVQPKESEREEREKTLQGRRGLSSFGHHPNCGSFSSHVIRIRCRVYCAGCVGLVVGSSVALVGTCCYLVLQSLSPQVVPVFFWFGLGSVTLGLLQYELSMNKASLHLLLNVIFVVGAFLLLVGVSEMNGSLSVGIYFLLVVLFLINVRTTLSRLEHERKCIACKRQECSMK